MKTSDYTHSSMLSGMQPSPSALLRVLPVALLCLLPLLTSSCSNADFFAGEKEAPLPGTRIAVLEELPELMPDPTLEKTSIPLPQPVRNQNWTQLGGNPQHTMGHLSLDANLEKIWSRSLGTFQAKDIDKVFSSPVVANGVIYAMGPYGKLFAFQQLDGKSLWTTETAPQEEKPKSFGGGIAWEEQTLFVTNGLPSISAFNAEDGSPLWSRKSPTPMRSAPTVNRNVVVVTTTNNRTFAFTANTGKLLWSHAEIEEPIILLGNASPTLDDQTAWIAYATGDLYALHLQLGGEVWHQSLRASMTTQSLFDIAQIRALPVARATSVFAVGNANRTVSLDRDTGSILWEVPLGGTETPWLAGSVLYQLTQPQKLLALDVESGKMYWSVQLERFEDPEEKQDPIRWHGPILAGGQLILTSSSGLIVFLSPQNGETRNIIDTEEKISVPPIVAAGDLIVLTDSVQLLVYRPGK